MSQGGVGRPPGPAAGAVKLNSRMEGAAEDTRTPTRLPGREEMWGDASVLRTNIGQSGLIWLSQSILVFCGGGGPTATPTTPHTRPGARRSAFGAKAGRSRGSLAVARSRCRVFVTEPVRVYEIGSTPHAARSLDQRGTRAERGPR